MFVSQSAVPSILLTSSRSHYERHLFEWGIMMCIFSIIIITPMMIGKMHVCTVYTQLALSSWVLMKLRKRAINNRIITNSGFSAFVAEATTSFMDYAELYTAIFVTRMIRHKRLLPETANNSFVHYCWTRTLGMCHSHRVSNVKIDINLTLHRFIIS